MRVKITAPEYQSPARKAKLQAGDEAVLDDNEARKLIRWGYAVEAAKPKNRNETKPTEAPAEVAEAAVADGEKEN